MEAPNKDHDAGTTNTTTTAAVAIFLPPTHSDMEKWMEEDPTPILIRIAHRPQ